MNNPLSLLVFGVPGLRIGGGGASAALANVSRLWGLDFNTDAAAPLPSPYTEESTATLVQIDGQFSKSSGALQFPAQATPVWGDQGFYRVNTFARSAGLAIVGKFNLSTVNQLFVGFGNGAGAGLTNIVDLSPLAFGSALSLANSGGNFPVAAALSTATDYYLAVVALSAGSAFYIKGGTFTDWTLLFHTNIATADLAPTFSNLSSAGALDYIHVGQIAASHALASGIKFTLDQATPAINTSYVGEDDGVTTLYYTLPGAPALNDRVEFSYNYTSADDRWRITLIWDGSQWNIALYSIISTVTTAQITVNNIGSTNAIRIIRRGNTHRLYTRNTSNVWTKRGADISNAAHVGVATTRIFTAGTWTLATLTAAPSTDAAYAVLDEV